MLDIHACKAKQGCTLLFFPVLLNLQVVFNYWTIIG